MVARLGFTQSCWVLRDVKQTGGRQCAVGDDCFFPTLLEHDPFIYKTLVRD